MGLFSGKTKISVSSVAYNIAGDADERLNFLKHSLIYLRAADESIGSSLPRMYLDSLGVKIRTAYRYAAGLPQGLPVASRQLWRPQDFVDGVQAIVDAESGPGTMLVQDASITETNTAPLVERHLNRKYRWDSVTGLMANPPAGILPNADITWFYEPPQDLMGDASPKIYRSFTIEFRNNPDSEDPDHTEKVSINAQETYHNARLVALISRITSSVRSTTTADRPYAPGDTNGTTSSTSVTQNGGARTTTTTTVTTVTDGTTTSVTTRIEDRTQHEAESRDFILGNGTWGSLDSIWFNRDAVEQTYFPSIPLRIDNDDVLDDKHKNTNSFKQTKRLCRLLGMDALQIRDQINDNPNIKDIDYAFLVCGANMNTQSQAEMAYLFRFWEHCMSDQMVEETEFNAWTALLKESRAMPPQNSVVIEDPESKNGAYKITISWDFIKKVTVSGRIVPDAKVGQYAIIHGATQEYDYGDFPHRNLVDSTVVSIRRQVSETHYEEIRVSGAVHRNDVYKGKTVETLARDARIDPEEHGGFVVPLHMGIFGTLPMVTRTQLAQECVYLIFNCYVKTKQKWYQTGAFKILLAIILIVVVIVTWGTTSAWAAGTWMALGATGTAAVFVALAVSMAIGYMASYLMGRWSAGLASIFGEKWARYIQVIVSVVVSWATGNWSNLNWLQTAVRILDVATQLFAAYTADKLSGMQASMLAFQDEIKEEWDKLKALTETVFGAPDLVSIDYLLHLQKTLRDDAPDVFLTRTLLTGSEVVALTLEQIPTMVENTISTPLAGLEA